jgi:hypothetical protein
MKFIALVEYDYPVLHKPPVKAELVLHGDRVETENVKIIAVDRSKKAKWEYMVIEEPETPVSSYELVGVGWRCTCCKEPPTDDEWWDEEENKPTFRYCPNCGAFMINWRDEE